MEAAVGAAAGGSPYGFIIQMALSLFGEMQARGENEKAQALLQGGLDEFGRIDLPKLERLVAEEIERSDVAGLRADPELAAAQRQSLRAYDDVIAGDGLALEDRAAINSIGNDAARRSRSSRDAIQADMAARGALGSGADYALQAKAGQDQAQMMNEAGLSTQSQALRRRFDAIREKGALAGQMRSQDFGERRTAAEAADDLRQYNARAREAASRYNAGLVQQDFENKLRRQLGKTGQLGAVADIHRTNAMNTREMWTRLGAAGRDWMKLRDLQEEQKKKGE